MPAYEVVYIDTKALTPQRLKTAAGKAIIKLLSEYERSLPPCFPSSFVTRGRYFDLQEQVDAVCGLSAAARKRADISAAVTRNMIWTEEVFLVVDERGRYVAGCTTRDRREPKKPNEIDSVCVSEKHRGRGVCGLMIAAAAKLYTDRGDDVKICCVTSNEGACRCYAKLFERKRKGRDPNLGDLTLFTGIRKDALPATGPRKL